MAKMNRKDYARQTEREMRDQMNGIRRNTSGGIIWMNGKATLRGIDEALIEAGFWSK